jgi:hypothetical protein
MDEVKLTAEMKNKMSEFMPVTVGAKFDYVPKAFRDLPKDDQPVFHLIYIKGTRLVQLEDSLYGQINTADNSVMVKRGQFVSSVCKEGIDGWDNYFGVKYEGKLDPLPKSLLYELCNAITESTALKAEEVRGLE